MGHKPRVGGVDVRRAQGTCHDVSAATPSNQPPASWKASLSGRAVVSVFSRALLHSQVWEVFVPSESRRHGAKLRRGVRPDLRLTRPRFARWEEPDEPRLCGVASCWVITQHATYELAPHREASKKIVTGTLCEGPVLKHFEQHSTLHSQSAQSINLVRVQRSPKGPLPTTTLVV